MSTQTLPIPGFHNIRLYASPQPPCGEWMAVAKQNGSSEEQDFGKRLARHRKEARYNQLEFDQEIGVLRRKRQVLQLIDAFIEREQLRSAKG